MFRQSKTSARDAIGALLLIVALIAFALWFTSCAPTCDRSVSTQHCCQVTGDGKTACEVQP